MDVCHEILHLLYKNNMRGSGVGAGVRDAKAERRAASAFDEVCRTPLYVGHINKP